jgi:Zn-dependent protease
VLRNIAITVCGLIALSAPLFLWLAWDKAMFWAVLAVGCGAVVAVFLLVRLSPEDKL